MSPETLQGWYEHFGIEGWPEERADRRSGTVAVAVELVAHYFGRTPTLKVEDFVMRPVAPSEGPTSQEKEDAYAREMAYRNAYREQWRKKGWMPR